MGLYFLAKSMIFSKKKKKRKWNNQNPDLRI